MKMKISILLIMPIDLKYVSAVYAKMPLLIGLDFMSDTFFANGLSSLNPLD